MARIRTKYGAVPTVIDGIRFDSRAESRRYKELKLLHAAGHIKDLRVHGRWELIVGGFSIGWYVDDFSYRDADGRRVVEDVKGVVTPVFRLKQKLMKALYNIDVVVVKAS